MGTGEWVLESELWKAEIGDWGLWELEIMDRSVVLKGEDSTMGTRE